MKLLKICARDYCQQWLRNLTSIYQEKLNNKNQEIFLRKRQEKFSDQSMEFEHQIMKNDNNNSMEKFKGLLCQINSTWAFRLINSRSYPNFGKNIGIVNNSRTIIVLQSKVRNLYIHYSQFQPRRYFFSF